MHTLVVGKLIVSTSTHAASGVSILIILTRHAIKSLFTSSPVSYFLIILTNQAESQWVRFFHS